LLLWLLHFDACNALELDGHGEDCRAGAAVAGQAGIEGDASAVRVRNRPDRINKLFQRLAMVSVVEMSALR
jgi:hypothetical protein